ncbi:ZIP family metal transporter [Candidatus Bathyarchaeota archaeon]|nr:ZIP family metal transporter [Candidatus Bathyarchaeota archaeon]
MDVVLYGLLASLLAGLSTGVGALPILFFRDVSDKLLDVMLGFAAGVMLAASSFSLIVPALELSNVWVVAIGFSFGALIIHMIDRFTPHIHLWKGAEGPKSKRFSGLMLMVLAIAIHNFPEGLAVGVSFGGGDLSRGLLVSLAIGLQNMPEGLAVAFPLVREGYSRSKALGIATLSGLVEPIGGLLGVALVSWTEPMLPWGLAFAAGAMVFVVSDEIIPESHRKGFEREATFGLIIGFLVMMVLDTYFG